MIKYIIFDLGQVIVKVDLKKFLINFGQEFQIDPAILINGQYDGIHQDFMIGKINEDEFHKKTCDRFEQFVPIERFRHIWNTMLSGEMDGTSDIINKLHQQKYSLVVLSNIDPWHFDYCKRNIPVLQKFERLFLSYDLKMKKPDPEIFLQIAKELNARASQCLFIDDTIENIDQAQSLDFRTIHFENAQRLQQELELLNVKI